MNSYVGMTMVGKKNREKMIISINTKSILLTLPAYRSPLIISSTYVAVNVRSMHC